MNPLSRTLRSIGALLIAGVVMLSSTGHGQTPGSLDPSFNIGVGPTNEVRALARQPDGKFLIAGRFVTFDDRTVNGIARVNANGSYDTSFNPGTGISGSKVNVGIYAVAVQSNGKIVVAGSFDSFNGAAHFDIARLNADGSVDASFNASIDDNGSFENLLTALAVQGDDKILIGGGFRMANGVSRENVARLNADGSLDGGFNSGTLAGTSGRFVTAIAVQPNGKIVLVGNLESNNVLRLNQDGSADPGFDISASPDGTVSALGIQSDGKIVIGGNFQQFGDSFRFNIARVNADGTLDTGYKPKLGTGNFDVLGIAIQADGKAVIAGEGDDETLPGVGRINLDGSVDTTYTAKLDEANRAGVIIYAAVPVPGNNGTLVGGGFGMIDGATVNSVALLAGGPGGGTPPSNHPAFFNGEANLGNGVYYLAFGGTPFGYYSFLADQHYIFHQDLGYEYVFDAADGQSGVYLYDFTSGSFFYTSPSFPFPYLYDFSLGAVLYYYPDPNNPGRYNTNGVRYFLNTSTGETIVK